MSQESYQEEENYPHQVYQMSEDYEILGKKGTYYQLYGGGPEGGLFFYNNKWYDVNREWFNPWTMKHRKHNLPIKIFRDEYGYWNVQFEREE